MMSGRVVHVREGVPGVLRLVVLLLDRLLGALLAGLVAERDRLAADDARRGEIVRLIEAVVRLRERLCPIRDIRVLRSLLARMRANGGLQGVWGYSVGRAGGVARRAWLVRPAPITATRPALPPPRSDWILVG